MTKFEFLGDLSRLISDLPEEDREQAMEYYEDYFADSGPEKEQEILNDFVSPQYIAEQIRASYLKRTGGTPATGAAPSPVPVTPVAPTPAPAPKAPVRQTTNAAKKQEASITIPDKPKNISVLNDLSQADDENGAPVTKMRNTVFQTLEEEDDSAEKALEQARKTKINIKEVNQKTAALDTKKSKKEKRNNASSNQYQSSLVDPKKKAVAIIVLIVLSPIWLSVLAIILAIFVAFLAVLLICVAAGAGSFVASLGTLILAILSLLTMHIPNTISALGTCLLLFAAGWIIGYLDIKLCTRILPGFYYSVSRGFKNVRAKIARFAAK